MNEVNTLAMNLGDSDYADQMFRYSIFSKMPSRFIKPVSSQYQQIYKQQGRRNANLLLLNIKSKLTNQIIPASSGNDDIV